MHRMAVHFTVLAVMLAASAIPAQNSQPPIWPSNRIEWSSLSERQRSDLSNLLDSKDWPIRVFGMMRLERLRGDAVAGMIRLRMLHDSAWQVRCFAIDQA